MAIITKNTKEGTEFSGKPKVVSEPRVWAFSGGFFSASGWPRKNIHTDLEFARQCGMSTRAVSATQYMGYLTELMLDLFGDSWLSNGKLNVKFINIVDVGDRLVTKAVVKSKEAQGAAVKFDFDVWSENQRGEKVMVGTASGLLT